MKLKYKVIIMLLGLGLIMIGLFLQQTEAKRLNIDPQVMGAGPWNVLYLIGGLLTVYAVVIEIYHGNK